ncbi:malate dehydrogenase-like [Leguminivora glycinivorella]|uniref:malate dehydrogenase-like n=1 Tax=Leguminivora glycinivorella TaxID=1035111 RepID=UPI00200BFC28|nr:malate dehydrogenase-like [Leguminivora glycinivorella]
MFATRLFSNILTPRNISSVRLLQVCVLGGASEIGQAVSLMLRTEPAVSKLVIHDTWETAPGVVIELSHIPAKATLKGYLGDATMTQALSGSDLVLLVGGLLKTPGVSDRSCVEANTEFVKTASSQIARLPKMPFVGVVAEPINSLVPMAAELMRNNGMFDGKKLFGVTEIDRIRVQTLYGARHGMAPEECFVPVIGGHSDKTTVPLVSQARPGFEMSEPEVRQFVNEVQRYESTVTEAKQGRSPTVSVAYGVLQFARSALRALQGQECWLHAFIENNDFGTSFFSGLVRVDASGAQEMARYTDNISQYECQILEDALNHLRRDVAVGKKVLEVET